MLTSSLSPTWMNSPPIYKMFLIASHIEGEMRPRQSCGCQSSHQNDSILIPVLFYALTLCFFFSGKPLSNRPVRLPGKVLHAALQEWEFNELQSQNPGQPLYCHGVFDAITAGEVQMKCCTKKQQQKETVYICFLNAKRITS